MSTGSTNLSTEVVPNLKDVVTDRVRAEFVRLIPDDAWKAMVEKELLHFTTVVRDPYDRKPPESPVQALIRAELRAMITEGIKQELQTEPYQSQWEGGRQKVGAAIQGMLQELAPELMRAMFGDVIQTACDRLRLQLQQAADGG